MSAEVFVRLGHCSIRVRHGLPIYSPLPFDENATACTWLTNGSFNNRDVNQRRHDQTDKPTAVLLIDNQVVAFIPHHGIDRRVGVRLLGDLLQQPPVHHVGHVRPVLRVHGAALAGPRGPDGVHRVLLVPLVHAEDLRVHQGGLSFCGDRLVWQRERKGSNSCGLCGLSFRIFGCLESSSFLRECLVW